MTGTVPIGGPACNALAPFRSRDSSPGGGGTDLDAALQAMIDGVRGCSGSGPSCPSKVDAVGGVVYPSNPY